MCTLVSRSRPSSALYYRGVNIKKPPLRKKSAKFFRRVFIINRIWPNVWGGFLLFSPFFGPFLDPFLSVFPLVMPQKTQNFSRAARANFGSFFFIIYKIWTNVLRGVFSYGGVFNINTPVVAALLLSVFMENKIQWSINTATFSEKNTLKHIISIDHCIIPVYFLTMS